MTAPQIDLTYAWGVIIAIATALSTVLQNQAKAEIIKHTGIASNSALLNDFTKAVSLAANFALDELSSVEAHNMTVTVKSAAVANGINTAGAQLQAAAAALGYSSAVIASAVSGEVAKALIPPASAAPVVPKA